MDLTMFLAQIWGPAMFAIGIGIFVSRQQYMNVYRNLEKEAFAVLIFGMTGIAAGIVHINVHNVWDTFPQIVISLLGWGLLIKAAAFTIVPRLVDWGGDFAAKVNILPAAGALMILLGGYLSWIAYFA